jgi:enoyl-CoA hydratase
MNTPLTFRLAASVATITMDDGKVNVLSLPMLTALNAALDRAQAQAAAVVLTGRPGVFSAGFDLPVLRAGGSAAHDMLRSGFQLAERLLSFPVPVVIGCNGHALAAGAFLVLAGDYRIGADGDFRIGANEVAIGLTMPHFGVEICRQRLAPAHFHRATINAEIYAPTSAVGAGFLDRVVSAENLAEAAQGIAVRLAQLNLPAHAATKMRARAQALQAIHDAIEIDDAAFRERH